MILVRVWLCNTLWLNFANTSQTSSRTGATEASGKFTLLTKFDVEELMIDTTFIKALRGRMGCLSTVTSVTLSTERFKQVGMIWLSSELAVDRSLHQYPRLRSYFLPECDTYARF